MALPPRTPPRFVPTLTEVVQVPVGLPGEGVPTAPFNLTGTSSPTQPVPGAGSATVMPSAASTLPPLPSARPPAVLAPRPASALPKTSVGVAIPSPSVLPAAALVAPVAEASPAVRRQLPDGLEEYMVHRVMQRVDVVLDQRLREAIAAVVQEQTRSVLPRLREEIESVVRHAVYEAVADELASGASMVPNG